MTSLPISTPGERPVDRLGPSLFLTSKTFWLMFLLVLVAGTARFSHSGLDGPSSIAFNHRKHADAGIECADCHSGVSQQARATLPALAVCLTCHESPVTQSPEEAKLRLASEKGTPLVWRSAVRLPSHVHFSHRRHVALGKVDCAVCHGDVRQSTSPANLPVTWLTMKRCMDCHARQQARSDCNDCHR